MFTVVQHRTNNMTSFDVSLSADHRVLDVTRRLDNMCPREVVCTFCSIITCGPRDCLSLSNIRIVHSEEPCPRVIPRHISSPGSPPRSKSAISSPRDRNSKPLDRKFGFGCYGFLWHRIEIRILGMYPFYYYSCIHWDRGKIDFKRDSIFMVLLCRKCL